MAKKKVKASETLVIEKWPEPSKENWQLRYGQKVFVGQRADRGWYILTEKWRIRRISKNSYDTKAAPDEYYIYKNRVSGTKLAISEDEIDAILDALLMVKDMIKSGQALESIIREESE